MPTKLRKLKITRVAVCPVGANPDADILLFKSATGAEEISVTKGPIGEMGLHGEPDGDEEAPLDYATRGQQYDIWEALWAKWEQFHATFYDVIGDGDADNVPHLPILERSISQFQADVHQLLVDGGVLAKVAPALEQLVLIAKVGSAMADHRRQRLQEAIVALQQILTECTPEAIDRAGMSAAEAADIPGVMATPGLSKGASSMAVRKNAESDKEHCDNCDDKDCDNPAHDRMKKAQETQMAKQEEQEARIKELETALAKAQSDLAARDTTIAKMKQTPEEQEAEYWAAVPESVRKKHEANEAEKVELRKQLDEARSEREQTVYIAKTADFRSFGMVQKHWHLLKAIDQMAEEDREELYRLIKAAQEQARTAGLFTAAGTSGVPVNGMGEGASASDELMAKTKAYQEEKGVSFAKASEAVAKAHPDLYQRMTRERRHAARVSAE